jgi:outer membrane protein assembly factor BamB
MSIKRRAMVVVQGIGFVSALLLLRAYAQEGKQVAQAKAAKKAAGAIGGAAGAEAGKEEMTDALGIPTDRKSQQSIQAAQDLITEKSWGEAAKILQKLLESKEDIFVEVERRTKDPDGKEKVTRQRTSLRVEANRLLGTMPAGGLEFYELQNGARAKADLAKAKETGDRQLLALVSQRYFHTAAGAEATDLLGTYRLDRGDYRMAALYFERLLSHHLAEKLSPIALYKAALAFQCTGDQPKFDSVWKQLTKKEPRGLTMGGEQVAWDRLQKEMDQFRAGQTPTNTFDWPTFGGAPNRAAQGNGGAPFLEVKWMQDMHSLGSDNRGSRAKEMVDSTLHNMEERQLPILPAFYPIAATLQKDGKPLPLVIYRSYFGIHAVNAINGKLHWETPSTLSIDNVAHDQQKWASMAGWIGSYGMGGSNPLFENSTLGSLSTDNTYVYVIEDLAVPPHPNITMQMQMNGGRMNLGGGLNDFLHYNRLQAFELDSGKIKWELGGLGADSRNGDKGELNDSFFLSAPLPLGDRLYVLNEKNGELRLLCLDPAKDASQGENPIVWTQTLATVRDKLEVDVGRRIQAALPAYGEGILVCPTNAGAVLAIDLLTHSLVWAHSYRKIPAQDPNQPMGMQQMMIRRGMIVHNGQQQNANSEWRVTAPVIQDGKIVYTPPDGNALLCLNLRDGTPAWEAARNDDLYLGGVYNSKVLLVGKNHCRALNLADGKEVWKEKTGTPSGLGTAGNNIYYLPLRKSARSKEEGPEVCAINIETGKIEKEARSRKKSNGSIEIPGNLLFYNGDVISQTALAVASYPQLKVKLAQIDERLKANPNDPIGLTERGELRLDGKDLSGAVADLRTALASPTSPNASVEEKKKLADNVPRTRVKLFDAFTELFMSDFSGNEKYLEEFKSLCQVPSPTDGSAQDQLQAQQEEQRRKAGFLCILGDGREKQGRLLEAFQAYEDFGGLGDRDGHRELISVPGHPDLRTRADVWAQGRIAAMVAKAAPEQRKPLEDKIASEWQNIQNSADTEKLRQFVRVFGSLFAVGKEARLRLAERLIDDNAFLEAEMNLLQLRQQSDSTLAARAVEDLARLMIRKNLLEDAAYYYRILGQDYGQTVIRDGKTGADLFNEQATDKRFLPYLDEPPTPWTSKAVIPGREVYGTFQTNTTGFALDSDGENLPFFQRYRLAISGNAGSLALKLTDRATGEDVWNQKVHDVAKISGMVQNGQNNFRLPHQHLGHLVILSVGPVVYAFDPIDRKIQWDKNLSGPTLGIPNQMMFDGNGNPQVYYNDGFFQRMGRTGPIEPSYVCLINRDGLMALDPVQGTTLWTKTDVNSHTQVFGDDQHVFLVDVNNGSAAAGTGRAVRAHDGAPVSVPDFAALYQRKLALVGRNLLLRENESAGGMSLRLYDVLTGKDLWKKSFAANSVDIKSDDPNLIGAVEPGNDGKVTVIDLRTRKDVLVTRLAPKDLEKVQDFRLLADASHFYLIVNKQPDPQRNQMGGFWANVSNGIRSVPVNGKIFAYFRNTGKLDWPTPDDQPISNQMLIVDHFRDMPILLFASRSNRMMRQGFNQMVNAGSVMSIEKRTGKLKFTKEYNNNDGTTFFALNVNPRNGMVELIRHNMKIVHELDSDDRRTARADGSAESKATHSGDETEKIIHGGAIIEKK